MARILYVVMHVMLRKSMSVYRELAFMVVNVVSLVSSIVRFSALLSAQSGAVSTHHSPSSSMFLRHNG